MERYKDLNSTTAINMQTNFLKLTVQVPNNHTKTAKVAGQFVQRLFQVLFYAHLILTASLVIFLNVRGFLSARSHHFHLRKWYPPLFAAIACAEIVAFAWQWITSCNPSRAIKIAFWFSPLLTCAVGVLLVLIGTAASSAIGAIAIVFAVIQSLYACWVNPRFNYATLVLSVSLASPPKTAGLVSLATTTGVIYSSFLVLGIGGATATGSGIDILFISVILVSLAWSMQVIKNALQVTIARIRYIHFVCEAEMEIAMSLQDTIKHSIGSVCIGSVMVPIVTVIRGSARLTKLAAGGTDEFLFSCADCYSAIASTSVSYANRWGFVLVGVSSKGFVEASMDTWETLKKAGLEPLIDSDLTGAFCFLCGVAGGAICSLAGGIWALAVHKSYATEISIYSFLIGYFSCRIAMAWPQSCISAYYYAYAENPTNPKFNSTIPIRIQELQRYQA